MTEHTQIENGLASLREAYFHLERAFFALHSTTSMSGVEKVNCKELLAEMEAMLNQIGKVT